MAPPAIAGTGGGEVAISARRGTGEARGVGSAPAEPCGQAGQGACISARKPAAKSRLAPWQVVFLAVFACSWGGNHFSPLLLLYKEHQHYSTTVVNAFLGVYVFGIFPALLLAGGLSDRHGRKPLLRFGCITGLLGSFCLAFSAFGPGWIYVGRLFSGMTVGVAMAVGSSWLKELSAPPHDPSADDTAGARRASLAFLAGSALGAMVAGMIAQLTPWGETLPFVLHFLLLAPLYFMLGRVPETSLSGGMPGPFLRQFAVPSAAHRRFSRVVMLAAPWAFVAGSVAYGYMPVLLAGASGHWGLAYATLLTVVTLGCASLAQPLARRLDTPDSARGVMVGVFIIAAGLVLAWAAVQAGSLPMGLATSVVLGAGLGICLLSGLLEVQRIANPRDLAGLTGVFYCVTYSGFLAPLVLSWIASFVAVGWVLVAVATLALLTAFYLRVQYRKHLPVS